MLLLVAEFMSGFHLQGLGTAIFGSIVVGITGWAANGFVGDRGRVEVWTVKR